MEKFIVALIGAMAIAIIIRRLKGILKEGSCGSCRQDCSLCLYSKEDRTGIALDEREVIINEWKKPERPGTGTKSPGEENYR